MYSINGVPLENKAFGWEFRGPSKPISDFTRALVDLSAPGRDGVIAVPASTAAPVIPLVVRTPRANADALFALLLAPNRVLSVTGVPGREVAVEFVTSSHEGYGDADAIVDYTILLRLSGVFWRDSVPVVSTAVALNAATVAVDVLAGTAQPVRDAQILVKGSCSGLLITDSGGDWLTYGAAIPAGKWWRFDGDAGRAFLMDAAGWSGGTEVTGDTDWSGRAYPFSIFPAFTDPAVRAGRLTVATSARSGAEIQVRGRRSYAFA